MARQRQTVRTSKNKARFLDALRKGLSIAASSQAAGFSRITAYAWRKDDEGFRQAWEDAIEAGTDALEDRVLAKAHRMDDASAMTGAIFLLKARRPHKYRDNQHIEHAGSIDVTGAKDRLLAKLRARERVENVDSTGGERSDG